LTSTHDAAAARVLGHEAAGTIYELGEGVTDLAIGDTVVVSWVPTCGKCRYCVMGKPQLCDVSAKATITLPDGTSRYKDAKGQTLNHFAGTGVMTEYAALHRDNVIKIDPSIGMDKAAIVGCAVMTGAGAALNTAKVEPGSTCVVFGAGGVGLNTIQGCAIAGAPHHRSGHVDKLQFAAHSARPTINPAPTATRWILLTAAARTTRSSASARLDDPQAYNACTKGGMAVVGGLEANRDGDAGRS
jgi:S-(hydroxymethyl)glutathione dehydrogenase/alcohol dehydrogenase